jgi:hypothetical protein
MSRPAVYTGRRYDRATDITVLSTGIWAGKLVAMGSLSNIEGP